MTTTITGAGGVSQVQDGSIGTADFAANAITASKLPAGSVLQVVNATTTTDNAQTSTSSSYVQFTALTAAITPTSTSSKILVMVKLDVNIVLSGGPNTHMRAKIYRGTSAVSRPFEFREYDYGLSGQYLLGTIAADLLDSPSTTSAITYSIYFQHNAGTTTQMRAGDLTLMEIAQ